MRNSAVFAPTAEELQENDAGDWQRSGMVVVVVDVVVVDVVLVVVVVEVVEVVASNVVDAVVAPAVVVVINGPSAHPMGSHMRIRAMAAMAHGAAMELAARGS